MKWIKTSDKLPALKQSKTNAFSKTVSETVLGWSRNNFWEPVYLLKIENDLFWMPPDHNDFNAYDELRAIDYYTHWMSITAPAEEK